MTGRKQRRVRRRFNAVRRNSRLPAWYAPLSKHTRGGRILWFGLACAVEDYHVLDDFSVSGSLMVTIPEQTQ